MLAHIFTHTVSECLGLAPFLFTSYLVIGFLEHKINLRHLAFLRQSGRIGPLVGALLGLIPQCGFSAATASFYSRGFVTRGTLVAAFLATSDEMLPILIANRTPAGLIIKILAVKVAAGMLVGFLIDAIEVQKSSCCNSCEIDTHYGCTDCSAGILKTAFLQTLKITCFLFIVLFAVGLAVELFGFEDMDQFILNRPVQGQLLAGFLSFIPNCAVSIVLTTLFLEGGMTIGTLLSGLLVGSGVGILVLVRSNHNWKDNLLTFGWLYAAGVTFGLLADVLPIF